MTARYAPYRDPAANDVYHLLFCDDAAAFAPAHGTYESAQQARGIAQDAGAESRVRMLAYNWLHAHGDAVASKELLGVIVEVGLDDGNDTLAAYLDGGVRYLNHTGRMTLVEGPLPALTPAVDALFAASRNVVARIGPWDKARLPPVERGNVRLTFLVADGLYFGEGPHAVLERDGMAGPVLAAATALLVAVTNLPKR